MKKKIFSKSMSWILSVVMMFGVFVIPSVSVSAVSEEERIIQQIKDASSWAHAKYGGSFYGMCGAYVRYTLAAVGIIDLGSDYDCGGNGNEFVGNVKEGTTSKGFTKVKYSGNNCLYQIINANGGGNVYNIVINWTHQYGYSNSNPGYGHVTFIHAILNGNVYFSESYDLTNKPEGTPLVYSLSDFMSKWNSYYGNAIGAVQFGGNLNPDPIEPVNIGTRFFATISNTKYGTYVSKVDGTDELYIQNKNGSSKQMWYFERQSDGAYVITSGYDDTVLEMTDGRAENNNILSSHTSFTGNDYQQWYIIFEDNGYKFINKQGTEKGWYMDRASKEDNNGHFLQAYEKFYDPGDQIWTIDKDDIFSNVGDRFYAVISSTKYGKAVSKVDGTNEIYLKDKNDTSKQIWYFDRQSDGSYVITSCYDETVLEMTDGVKGDAKHICAKESYSDKTYQQWYLIPGGYGYRLVNKFCMNEGWYFDRSSFGDDNGNYIQVYQKYYDSSDQVWSIDTVGAIADLGEHFYCSIGNTKYGKAVSKIGGTNDIYLQDKNKTSKQIWYFDRQTDGAYVITSCYDETVLEMTNGEKGNYKRISAHDNFSGESYQQWYMIASGDGYRIINKYCINECWYFDRSSNGDSNGNFIQIHEKYYDPSDQIWTIDKAGAVADLGEKFYSRITNTRYGGDVTKIKSTNNVYLQNENSDAEQVWLFEKQSDGAYSISSCFDGKALEMTNGVREDGKQISAYQNYNGVSYQQWYLISSGKGYRVLNKHYMNEGWYLDRSSRSDDNGSIIQIFEKYPKAEDQIWNISKTNKPSEPIVNNSTVSSETVKLGSYITINASASGGTGDYTYAVWYKRSSDSSWTTKQNYSTNATIKIKPASAEKYDISVKVKDSSGTIVKKAFTVNVFAPLKNTTTISSSSIGYGGTFTVKAKATGGLGDYTYAVYYKKASATKWTTAQNYSSTKTITIKPKYAEEYDVSVKVKDSSGVVAKKTFKIKVTKPTNTSKVASTTIILGNTIDITCSATGGSGFYQYAVYYKKSSDTSWKTKQSYSSNTNVSIKPASKTKYDVSVKVKDSLGNVSKKAFTITVK